MTLAASLASALVLACGEEEPTPPGLLLVTVDSLRADFLSCYGGLPGVGERMCGLADAGTRYSWAFAPASSSAPAIASLLTSQYPNEHGVGESAASFLPDEHTTLAEQLQRAGFATAAFVASPELNRSRNLHQGFEVYDDFVSYPGPGMLPLRSAAATTEAALAWLEDATPPWFLWIHYREPHGPYRATPTPDDEGTMETGGERLRVLARPIGRGGLPSYQAIPGLFTREGYEARYRAEIRTVDNALGVLLDAVETRPEPVGVVLTADHGEAFGEDRYYLSHGHSVSLDQIRVPLFWRPPVPLRPEQIRVVVSTLDVLPTLVRAAGLDGAEAVDGWVLPSAADPPGAPEQARAVFAIHPERVAVVSGSNYYSRLRGEPGSAPGDVTAEFLAAHAARTASLGPGEALPVPQAARPTGITPLLEPRVRAFLEGRQEQNFLEDGRSFPKRPTESITGVRTKGPNG